ncbi:YihY/virulence factor BrkB family protein [soil metagenome]
MVRQLADRVRRHRWAREASAVLRAVAGEWRNDRLPDLAAGVAFWVSLSVFPLLISVAAGLGVIEALAGAEASARTEDAVLDVLDGVLGGEQGADLVEAVRSLFDSSSTGVLTFGLLGALYTGSRGVAGVVRALDVAYDLPESRGWLATRLVGLAIAVGSVVTGTALVAMVVLGPLLGGGEAVADSIGLGGGFAFIWDNLRGPVAFVVVVTWAATVFHIGPNRRTPWRSDLPGAVLTASGWIVVSLGFRVYLEVAAAGNQVLGVLGGGLVLLLWLYLLSVVLLLGGELNAVLIERRSSAGAAEGGE